MSYDPGVDDGVDEKLRKAAEYEMRRFLPNSDRPSKRAKTDAEQGDNHEVGRFDYNSVGEISSGMTGFLVSCVFRR